MTDLLGSEATIAKHKHSILLGISQCTDSDMTRERLWEGIVDHVPESLQCLKECLFLFNPLSPEAGWDRAGCLAALDRLAKVSDPSSILSVSLNDSDLYALHILVDALGEEIATALSGGDLASASSRYRSLDRLSVIDHEKIKSLLSSTRSRISSWLREQEGKFRFQYAMHDFTGAERLLSSLRDVSTSLGASEVDLSSLRAELDSAREAYEVQQAELASLREALSANAERVESNHSEVLGLFKEQKAVFEQQQAAISVQLQDQELAFGRRMELLEGQLRSQEASYVSRLEEMASAHKSELSRREAEIRQDVQLNAEQQAAALSALQQKLEMRYKSEQQAQEARHSQAVARLAAERSDAESALNSEKRRLLAEQQESYEKRLGDLEAALEQSQSENQTLSAKNLVLQDELKRLQSSLRQSPSGVVSGPQTPPNVISSSRPALSPEAATLSSFGDSVLDASVWERYYGAVDSSPSRPSGIDQVMNSPCPFWEGCQVRDTHMLVLIPSHVGGKPLTLDYLGELIQSPKGDGYGTKYRDYEYYAEYVRPAIGSQASGSSYWVLMTKDVLPGSRNKRYEDQRKLVADHANRTGLGYEVPGALEAAVVMLLHHAQSGERLYSVNPETHTRCRDKDIDGNPVVVGGFSSGGLYVSSNVYDYLSNGVAGLRKF